VVANRKLVAVTGLLASAVGTLFAAAVLGSYPGRVPAVAAATTHPSISTATTFVDPTTVPIITSPPVTSPATVPASIPATTSNPAGGAPTTVPRSHSPPAPRTYAPAVPYPTATLPPTTAAPTTTIVGIGGRLPVAPSTLPLTTMGSNAHVNPVLAILSGIGFGIALLIIAGRLIITRSGGRDRKPVEGPAV
jgi:hypothetical protein